MQAVVICRCRGVGAHSRCPSDYGRFTRARNISTLLTFGFKSVINNNKKDSKATLFQDFQDFHRFSVQFFVEHSQVFFFASLFNFL